MELLINRYHKSKKEQTYTICSSFIPLASYQRFDSSEPALNLAVFFAGMSIGFFVRGLIPFLALLSETENVPNPTNTTFPPAFTSSEIVSSVASNAFLESTLLRPDFSAIALISSDLFIKNVNKKIKHTLNQG